MVSSQHEKDSSEELKEEVTQLYLSGDSIDKVASDLNLEKSKVVDILTETLSDYQSERGFGKRLNSADRQVIAFFHNQGRSNYYIARVLECHQSTVARELARCEGHDHYDPKIAQDNYNSINHRKRGKRKK